MFFFPVNDDVKCNYKIIFSYKITGGLYFIFAVISQLSRYVFTIFPDSLDTLCLYNQSIYIYIYILIKISIVTDKTTRQD